MTNSTVRRSLSVGQRLWTLGGAAFIGFGSMIAIGWYENMQVDAGLRRTDEIQQSIDTVNDMRVANLTLVLTAMDMIVDKDEKTIQPGRLKLITDSLATLSSGSKGIGALAEELKAGDLLKSYDADVDALRQAIQVDLKALVEQGAADDEFDKIDDRIDSAGDKLTGTLDKLANDGTAIARNRIESANDTSHSSLIIQIALGLIAILTMAALQYIHGGSISRGIAAVRESMLRIMNGDLTTNVAGKERGDEIGEMARAAESFRLAAIEKIDLEARTETDRKRSDAERRERETAKLADTEALNNAVTALGQA